MLLPNQLPRKWMETLLNYLLLQPENAKIKSNLVQPNFNTMTNINITLPESLKSFIDQEIAAGNYNSASEYLQQLIIQEARRKSKGSLEDFGIKYQELENALDELADDFAACVGANAPILSDYAVSRESIYEDHY
ncbi:type II toxin-antitoxin system ParD family antitoxin [Sphaerospermopsis sp. LEGE 08334]|uniref:ribbon-helix-helix domain-containing protein n=1 Tax=Sphaerospermopsis sp. LEGE 08334 TaxID=1828651 RepID=UPI001D13E2B5|nr:type II toxin-antitoxin system ParD family antitoxin [Sphaerospermopsis sp. LEGE 08334]